MPTRDRRQIRYEQFTRKRRIWPWGVGAVAAAVALAGGWTMMTHAASTHRPPLALSHAGGPVAGEAYQWRHVAVGGGGFITGLSMDATGATLVARTDVYGAYIWLPAANRWAQLVTAQAMPAAERVQAGLADGVYEIAVAPSRPTRIYMAIKGRVFRSDDRGAHWLLASAGNPFPFAWDANGAFRLGGPYMAVSPTNPDLVLLGTPTAGLLRSADAGASWQHVGSMPTSTAPTPGAQPQGTLVWFQPGGTGRIWAMAAGHGMSVSTDGGAHFTQMSSAGAQPMQLSRGAFDRKGNFYGVDITAKAAWVYHGGGNGGGAWRDLHGVLPVANFVAVAAAPQADQVAIFDDSGTGWQSRDEGVTWSTITHTAHAGPGDPPWLHLADQAYFATADVRFDPAVPGRIWIGAGMGVFHADLPAVGSTVDWESQTRGIEELVANDIVQAPGQSPVFAGWDFGLHVKDDLTAFSTTFGPGERALMSVQQLDWTPAAPDFLVTNATDARVGCCAADGNAVMAGTSRDGGRAWRKFANLPTPPGTKPNDPWRMSFGTIAVSSSDAGNIVWEPAYNRAPFVTRNGGADWAPIALPGAVSDTSGSFEHTWYQRKTLAADKVQPGVFYLVHSGEAPNMALQGLWRSRDGGGNWERVFTGEIAPASNLAAKLRAVPGHGGHLFFTSAFEHVDDTTLRRSRDGGASWELVAHVDHVDDIAFGKAAPGAHYPAIYLSGRVFGAYGVWRSVDDAANWQLLTEFPSGTLDQVTVVAADPDVFGRVYLGYKGSGWIWGEPAPCRPGPQPALSDSGCVAVK